MWLVLGLAPAAPAVLCLGFRRQQWISRPVTQGCLMHGREIHNRAAEKSTNRVVHKVDMWGVRDHSGAKWRTNHGPVRPTEDRRTGWTHSVFG